MLIFEENLWIICFANHIYDCSLCSEPKTFPNILEQQCTNDRGEITINDTNNDCNNYKKKSLAQKEITNQLKKHNLKETVT